MIGNIAYYDYPVDYGKNDNGKNRRYPEMSTKEQDKKTKRHFDIILTDDEGKPYLRQVLDRRGRPIRVPVMEHVVDENGDWVIDYGNLPEDVKAQQELFGNNPLDTNKFNWLYKQKEDEEGNPLFEDLKVPDENFARKMFSFGPDFVKYIRGLKDIAKNKGESFKWNPVVFSNTGIRDESNSDDEEKLYYDSDDLKRLRKFKDFVDSAGPIFTDEGIDKKSADMWEKILNVGDDFNKPFDPNKAAMSKAKEKIWNDAKYAAQLKRDKINDDINKRDFITEEERERNRKTALNEISKEMFDTIEEQLRQYESPNIKKKYPEEMQKKEKPDKYKIEADKQMDMFNEMLNTTREILQKDSSLSAKEKNARLKELSDALAEKQINTFEDIEKRRQDDDESSKTGIKYDPFNLFGFNTKLAKNNRKSAILDNILNESMDFSPLLGDPLDERPMPYIYADLGTKADSMRVRRDEEGKLTPSEGVLDDKYRKKLYGWKYKNHPNVQWDIFRDNENSPFYNLNHPMWNMSDEEYAKWSEENPDLVTISPKYADYTGKLVRNAAGEPRAMDYDARDKRRMRRQGIFKGVPILSKNEALDYLTGSTSEEIPLEDMDDLYEVAKRKWGNAYGDDREKYNKLGEQYIGNMLEGNVDDDIAGMLSRATDENGVVHPELLPRFTSMALLQNYPKTFDENGRLIIDLDKNIRNRNADGTTRKARVFDPEKRDKQLKDRYINALLEDALKTWSLTPEQRKANFDPRTMEILAELDEEDAKRLGEQNRTRHYLTDKYNIVSKKNVNDMRKSDINTIFNNNVNKNAANIEFLNKRGIPVTSDAKSLARKILDYDTYEKIFTEPITRPEKMKKMLEVIANSPLWEDFNKNKMSVPVMNTLINMHSKGGL